MNRLHLITSRKPIAGAAAAGDTLVFMNSTLDESLFDEVLLENPQITQDNLRVIKPDVNAATTGPRPIEYEELVQLVVQSDSVVSW